MTAKHPPHPLVWVGIIMITGLMLSPLMALSVNIISGYDTLDSVWSGEGLLGLLLNTIFFSLGVTVSGFFIAVPAASVLANISGKKGQTLRLLAVSPIVVPPYLHALAWQRWLQSLGLPTQGDMIAFWIETLARLPLLVAATLIGFAYMHPMARDAVRIYANPARGFLKLTLPQLKAPLIAGFCIVLLFSINEYGLPSLFMRSTYPLEIFARYSATGDSGEALLFAFPIVLMTAALAMIAVTSLSRLSVPSALGRNDTILFAGPALFDIWRIIALVIVAFQLIIPFKEIIMLSLLPHIPIMTNAAVESLQYSSALSIAASTLTLPLAWLLSEYLHRYPSHTIWLAILLGFALPPSLTGIGNILFWSWAGMENVYNGWFLPVLGYMTRLLPLSTLFIYAVIRNSDPLLWDAARLYQHGWRLWVQIRLFQVWPGMAGALLVGFSITLADLELSLLLSPAGMTSIGVRLFNYLHYGAPEQVAYLSLLVLATTLLLGGGLSLLMTRHANGTGLLTFGRIPS